MKTMWLAVAVLTAARAVAADDVCPKPCDGKCLTPDQVNELKKAVSELDNIHKSPATVEILDPIVVIRDWDGRVYVNGGSSVPLKAKVRVGQYVDRDMSVSLKPQVWYRPEPPSPMLRLRIRAQAGILFPSIWQGADAAKSAYDAGLGFDFFHLGIVNLTAYTGVRSIGGGPGLDVTKNFGIYAGYALAYDGFKSNAMLSAYFSFN